MHKLSFITSVALLLFLVACASNNYTDAPPSLGALYSKYVYIGYSGELKPIEDVGIITTDGLVKITEVDGISINKLHSYQSNGFYTGGRVQLHLLPGQHYLWLTYHDDRGDGTVTRSKEGVTGKQLTITKGQVIHLRGIANGYSWDGETYDGSSAINTIINDFNELVKNSKD